MTAALILAIAGALLGAVAGIIVANQRERRRLEAARDRAARVMRDAWLDGEAKVNAAEAEAGELRKDAEAELEERRARLVETEERLAEKAKDLDRKAQSVAAVQRNLGVQQEEANAIRGRLSEIDASMMLRLAEISGVSAEQAGEEVLAQIERGLRDDAQVRLREAESGVRERADEVARRLLADTMQRISSPRVSTSPGSSVALSERDQRKIASTPDLVEQLSDLAGVTMTVSDDGASVRISGPDAVKRELARVSLTEALKSRRTSPNDIDRLVRRQEQRLEKAIREGGIAAVRRAGCGRLPDQIISAFGRLQYRYSYGQNQLLHAVETAHLAAMLARELGANVEIARAGGLLHDMGKAVDREVEGTHAAIGGQMALDAGLDPRIAHCISAHHEEVDPETTEAVIAIVADAMSGARPGARRESLENYLGRLEALEAVASGFSGVEKCYAIQAGRELRVLVNPDEVDDQGAARIAQAISERIQESLEYPGQIKVMVIREVRAVEHTH